MNEHDSMVQVEIHGRTYKLRADANPHAVRELAAYVDDRMKEIAEQTETVDSAKIAILVALNIAGELMEQQQVPASRRSAAAHARRDNALCEKLDEALVS